MKNIVKALVFMAVSGGATAGDLVLKLGTTGNFRYHRIPVTGNVTVSPSTGDITVDPVAEVGVSNDGWCPAGGGGGPTAPVVTSSLAASTNSLPVGGGSVTLTWAMSGVTNNCTANSAGVSGWNGNVVTSPTTVNLTASGNYSFSVTCSNATGSTSSPASGGVTVTVANSGVDPSCISRPPPLGIARQTSITNINMGGTANQQNNEFGIGSQIAVTHYVPLFGTSFNQSGQSARLFTDTGKYVAMEFSTSGVNTGATGSMSWSAGGLGQATLTAQISACPGDFGWELDPNCMASGLESGLSWKVGTKPASNPGFWCYLSPNKTYYVNAIFANAGTVTTTACPGATCDSVITIGGH